MFFLSTRMHHTVARLQESQHVDAAPRVAMIEKGLVIQGVNVPGGLIPLTSDMGGLVQHLYVADQP